MVVRSHSAPRTGAGVQRLAGQVGADHRDPQARLEQRGDPGEAFVRERRADQHDAEGQSGGRETGRDGDRRQVEEVRGVGEAAQPGVGAERVGGDLRERGVAGCGRQQQGVRVPEFGEARVRRAASRSWSAKSWWAGMSRARVMIPATVGSRPSPPR